MQNEINCAGLLKRINDKMEKRANERMSVHDVTFTQMQMMMMIYCTGTDAVPLKQIEKHFEVAQSTAAGVIARLEKKEMVVSSISAEDKRLKILRLTDKGKALCRFAINDMEESDRILLECLDPEEQDIFYRLLEKVNNKMR